MHARSWFVLTAVCTLVCTSGCGSARWGNRHSRLHMPSQCVEGCCDDPTCEICSPLPPLYDGMARSHRLNRRAMRGHGHGHGRRDGGCPYCGQCGDGEWFEGEIIDGEIIGGDCCFGGCSSCMSCGGCSSCSSCGDGMMMDGMPMQSGCSSCQQHSMMGSSMPQSAMMSGQTYEMHEQQPTLAPQQRSSSVPNGGAVSPPPRSSVPGDLNAAPMGSPMGQPTNTPESPMPMSMRTPNYGAALFGGNSAQSMPQMTASADPVIQEQAMPMEMMQSPMPMSSPMPLASPVAQSQPMLMATPSMPTFPVEQTAAPQPSDFYSPKDAPTRTVAAPNPIQLQSAATPATPGKKPMRPFSEAAKPKSKPVAQPQELMVSPPAQPQGQPQWEGTLKMQPMQQVQQASADLPALPKRSF